MHPAPASETAATATTKTGGHGLRRELGGQISSEQVKTD